MIRKLSVMLLLCLLISASTAFADPTPTSAPSKGYVEAIMYFKVSSAIDGNGTKKKPFNEKSFRPIPNARLIIIDYKGNIVTNGLTDSKGQWNIKINTPIDPRFPTKNMGVVTVITVADGFNEFINFNVSVNEHGNRAGKAAITLRPIKPDARNEPSFNAGFHRFTVFEMLDFYAKQIGLVKQKQIQGAEGFGEVDMPWSATSKKSTAKKEQ